MTCLGTLPTRSARISLPLAKDFFSFLHPKTLANEHAYRHHHSEEIISSWSVRFDHCLAVHVLFHYPSLHTMNILSFYGEFDTTLKQLNHATEIL
jgi:hypothetical protein